MKATIREIAERVGSFPDSSSMPFAASLRFHSRAPRNDTVRPSNPTVSPGFRFVSRYDRIDGVFSCPMRIRSIPEPSSSFSAWMKYRPSVQSAALSASTTRVPALPVNPEKCRRAAK